jgi:hypothetical protein
MVSKRSASSYKKRLDAVMRRPVTVQGVYYWEDVGPGEVDGEEYESKAADGDVDSVNRMAMARAGSSRRGVHAGPLSANRRDYFNPGGGAARPGSASRSRSKSNHPEVSGGMFVVGPGRNSVSRSGSAATAVLQSETPALERRRRRQRQERLNE